MSSAVGVPCDKMFRPFKMNFSLEVKYGFLNVSIFTRVNVNFGAEMLGNNYRPMGAASAL